MANPSTEEAMLEMRGIVKVFPGVQALEGVDFNLRRGEVHALLGENGAGKSTLMRVLFGIHSMDSGEIVLRGQAVTIRDPHHALQLGITMVHQELNLVPGMNAAQNIALGHESTIGATVLKWPAIYAMAQEQLERLGIQVDLRKPVKYLSVAQQQLIEIAKALSWNAEVMVMDEPTSSLTGHEIAQLFTVLRRLTAKGVGVVFISHRLEEIYEIADRVTVLRDGQHIGTWATTEVKMPELIRAMVGRSVQNLFPKYETTPGAEALRVEGLTRKGVLHDISFVAYKGEILGIAGLVGAGRTELVRAIFGADPIDAGAIYIEGQRRYIRSPQDAIRYRLGLAPEDRKQQGLVLLMSVQSNVALALYDRLTQLGFIHSKRRQEVAQRYVDQLKIKTPNLDRQVRYLSGGTQQKVVIARWLACGASIFIFDEPTRGIDVGAKVEVHQLMSELAQAGRCVIMISSELPEILGMSDRVLVMREGQIVAEVNRAEATQEIIMSYASGADMSGENAG